MNLHILPRLRERAKAGIWGFIIGDALGVPYEFLSRNELKESPAVDMVGWGTHSQPPGTWSDDTSMMLCVLENNCNTGSRKSLASLFLKWYEEGYHTANGDVFDIGITTREAMVRLKSGTPPGQAGSADERSAGNGSLMRSLPYAFVEDFGFGFVKMLSHNRITHGLLLCDECCLFYTRMARSLAEGKSKKQALAQAGGYLRMGWRMGDDHETEKDLERQKLFQRLFNPAFPLVPEEKIASTGYVIETLEAAVWCFMNGTDYRSCVLKAVKLGGDTDTIAALTGGLAGIYFGFEDIPVSWRETIVGRERLEHLFNRWMNKCDDKWN